MFDTFSGELFSKIPRLDGLSTDEAKRKLSMAYLSIIELKGSLHDDLDVGKVLPYLRKMANALESYAIFDKRGEQESRYACAFIAAEALSLAADYGAGLGHHDRDSGQAVTRLEAALLYLIANYQSNAGAVLAVLPRAQDAAKGWTDAREWCFDQIRRLCEGRLSPLPPTSCPVEFSEARAMSPGALVSDTTNRLYGLLGELVGNYIRWLSGSEGGAVIEVLNGLQALITSLRPPTPDDRRRRGSTDAEGWVAVIGDEYARVHHLAMLLRSVVWETQDRALVHSVTPPSNLEHIKYYRYLSSRASGTPTVPGRPLLWPSMVDYVRECINGTTENAVAAMPTGSGKSFLAELAISQTVGSGWCLYLVPTNALAHQVRRDLRSGLSRLQTKVAAFLDEDSLENATDLESAPNCVTVMTPEKCSLALRLFPEAFTSCHLVVFDECHLIGDISSRRQVTAELVMSQLILLAPYSRFLLMSALVQNPEDLAGWLSTATGKSTAILNKAWRPTRTLRAALAVNRDEAEEGFENAKETLMALPNRVKYPYAAGVSLVGGLQGAWQQKGVIDYALVRLPFVADFKVIRDTKGEHERYSYKPESWVNGTAARLASFLGESGIQTLVFAAASKHFAFSIGCDVSLSRDVMDSLTAPPDILRHYRTLAEYELGVASQAFELLSKGVAVHTAALVETEKLAAELAFSTGSARVLLATGTLAQGLNLPAMAVVIAGSRIGDTRGQDEDIVQQRKLSQLVNAAGRAGRAGFANQGIVIAIPDRPVLLRSKADIRFLRSRVDFLQQSDNVLHLSSGLDPLLDSVAEGHMTSTDASAAELQVISVLAGGSTSAPGTERVLQKSFAAYRRQQIGLGDVSAVAAERFEAMRKEFLAKNGAPEWIALAAQTSGLDFWLTLEISRAWARVQPKVGQTIYTWSVQDWADRLLDILAHIPPAHILRHFSKEDLGHLSNSLGRCLKDDESLILIEDSDWVRPELWKQGWLEIRPLLRLWLSGQPLVKIASALTNKPEAKIKATRTAGHLPMPKALAFVDACYSLSGIAGGLVAVAEKLFQSFAEGNRAFAKGIPDELESLPLCIRYGFDSVSTLAWYRFGIRLRRPAHLFARLMPPPAGMSGSLLRRWVRSRIDEWYENPLVISGTERKQHGEILDAMLAFVRSTRGLPD